MLSINPAGLDICKLSVDCASGGYSLCERFHAQRWALGGIIILIQSHINKELLHVFGKVVF